MTRKLAAAKGATTVTKTFVHSYQALTASSTVRMVAALKLSSAMVSASSAGISTGISFSFGVGLEGGY